MTQHTTLDDTAFLFPGQGNQSVGMGQPFHRAWPETRRTFDRLDGAVDTALRQLCFAGTEARLREPSNIQPVQVATSYSVFAGVSERFGVEPAYYSGHSLGQFTAITAAEMLAPETAVSLTKRRGECMERAASRDGPGTMVAVLVADAETVADACREREDVGVALYNAPGETVVSGTPDGVAAIKETLESRTRARFHELAVEAAFHSPVMASAVDCAERAMADVSFDPASRPVVSDVSGEVYTEPAVPRRDLTAQITSPVNWIRVVERLRDAGVERFVEFPPAGVLTSLVERIAPEATCIELSTPADARAAFA
ncbi:ACP S-malonyltransferase [Haloarcula salinisoli]|uniref:[acyl-carrier-protein] S-malonyltransferase n=1 Tax=Haloarcula salinisoli TaxID=2487746 RepID=A0A8J7YH46_9EURY|nr:ACP S-malonyltransferase [Halomicroarcula salinisoli]MBX0303333.1 ACP S-malonyltransferase [Halomicroarcula salinisoli]